MPDASAVANPLREFDRIWTSRRGRRETRILRNECTAVDGGGRLCGADGSGEGHGPSEVQGLVRRANGRRGVAEARSAAVPCAERHLPAEAGWHDDADRSYRRESYGVFVIETKTYKGWIFGDANSKVWTQSFRGKGRKASKFTFQNPIHQNYEHLCALENCTGIPKDVMKPVIAFSGEATFKTERPDGVCYFGGVVKYIKSFTTSIIRDGQVDEIVSSILDWQATLTKGQIAAHVDNLKKRHEGVSASEPAPKCPYCGAPMVRRVRKADGKPFYGCSKYPACKGIANIRV